MLKTIDFINHNTNWREVLSADPYHLKIKDDSGFTMLKYSQIDSDFHNEIVRECRGLIIDQYNHPVCIPFFKFGNYGEDYADQIDWCSARAEEKIDGSLIKVWNYEGEWIVSTNGTIFAKKAEMGAELEIGVFHGESSDAEALHRTGRFANYYELFEAARKKAGLRYETLHPGYTYMFEVVSPYNRVVVPYSNIELYHIGTRDHVTMKEVEFEIGVRKPEVFACDNLSAVIEMASRLPYSEEGYVVRDKHYRRIKVKSPAYVAVHRSVAHGISEKSLLELIRSNETEELLSYFPEYRVYVDRLKARIQQFTDCLNAILLKEVVGREFESRKEFAAMAMETEYPAFLFHFYDGKVATPAEWIWSMPNDKIWEQLVKWEGLT